MGGKTQEEILEMNPERRMSVSGKSLWIAVSLVLLLSMGLPAGAADSVWIRAAYWDARYPSGWNGTGESVRDALQHAGYQILNADQLKTWMTDRISDKKLSVVVFVKDVAPDTVVESQSSWCTLRRYLNAGGKIVWPGDIPFYYQGHANGQKDGWWGGGAVSVLGFDTWNGSFDSGQITFTAAGVEWGLTQTWSSSRPMVPGVTTDLTILATDNKGNIAAWVKHYLAGDDYRGFVRFFDRDGGQVKVQDIIRVAEYTSPTAVLVPPMGIRNTTKPWDLANTNGGVEMPSYVIRGQAGLHETTALKLNKLTAVHQAHTYRGVFYAKQPGKLVSPTATGTINVTWPALPNAAPSSLPFTKLKVLAFYHASRASLAVHPLVGDAPAPQVVSATAKRLGVTATGTPSYDLTLELTTGPIPAGDDGWISVVFETNGAEAGWVASKNRIYSDVWTTSASPGQVLNYAPAATAAVDVGGFRLKNHWKLDEGQGTVARDSVGNSDGTIMGCDWVDGMFGKALFFDGSPYSWVDLGKSSGLIPMHMSASVWVKPNSWNGEAGTIPGLLTREVSLTYWEFMLCISGLTGKYMYRFGTYDSTAPDRLVLYSTAYPVYGEWTLLTATRDGHEAVLSVNGVKDVSATYNFDVQKLDAICSLGSYHGIMDELRIYDGALSERDVLDLYLWEPPAVIEAKEDFENGFSLNWQHSGDASWQVTSSEAYSGSYSARAGELSNEQSSVLRLTTACQPGEIRFFVKTSSESGFDLLTFLIDGNPRDQWSGEQGWQQVSYPVTAGNHTFEWVYSKDGSSISGEDTAWLDEIVLPVVSGGPTTPANPATPTTPTDPTPPTTTLPSQAEIDAVLTRSREIGQAFKDLASQVGRDQARQTTVDSLRSDPLISNASISSDGTTILLTYKCGLPVAILAGPEGSLGGGPLVVASDDELWNDVGLAISFFWPEHASLIEPPNSAGWGVEGQFACLGVDFEQTDVFTLDTIQSFDQYKIVYIRTHGGVFHGDEVGLATGERVLTNFWPASGEIVWADGLSYLDDWASFRIAVACEPDTDELYWAFLPDYVKKYCPSLPPNLIYASACSSLANHTMAQAFLDRGAKEYIGWSHAANVVDSLAIDRIFFEEMTKPTIWPESGPKKVSEVFANWAAPLRTCSILGGTLNYAGDGEFWAYFLLCIGGE